MTRKELCEKTGIYSGRLSQIINGKYSTGSRVQQKIANSLGYELDQFLSLGRTLTEGSDNVALTNATDKTFDVIIKTQEKTIKTQEKYIEKLEAENAYLKKLLGAAGLSAEEPAVPIARIPDALVTPKA